MQRQRQTVAFPSYVVDAVNVSRSLCTNFSTTCTINTLAHYTYMRSAPSTDDTIEERYIPYKMTHDDDNNDDGGGGGNDDNGVLKKPVPEKYLTLLLSTNYGNKL